MFEVERSVPPTVPQTILALDFETYFDVDYTLKKLSTSEYIRDLRFYAYGAGVKTYNPTDGWSDSEWIRNADLNQFLADINWRNTALLCHNTAFDGLVLSHHYGVVPGYYLDTMSMARGLHDHDIGAGLEDVASYYGVGHKLPGVLDGVKGVKELTSDQEIKLAGYCLMDVELTTEIYDKMKDFPKEELDLIHITINAFCNPVLEVNLDLAREELEAERTNRENTLEAVSDLIIEGGYYELIWEAIQDQKEYANEKNKLRGALAAKAKRDKIPRLEKVQSLLSSNRTFVMLLEALGETVAEKEGTNALIPAIAKDDLEFKRLQVTDTPHVAEVCEARLIVKSTIGETRAAKLIDHALPRLPIMLNYCKAHTMRWSGGDKLNPQNFPAGRKGKSDRLRRSIVAPDGYVVVVADSSQIEDRMNCWLSGQIDMVELYRQGKIDPYCYTAEMLYNLEPGSIQARTEFDEENNEWLWSKEDKGLRGQGKVARLGLGYGCGAQKFAMIQKAGIFGPAQPHYTEKQAKTDVLKYRKLSEAITDQWYMFNDLIQIMSCDGSFEYKPVLADAPILIFDGGRVHMPNGLSLNYPGLHIEHNKYSNKPSYTYYPYKAKKPKYIYGGLLVENVVQCLARIVVGEQMRLISQKYHIVMMTHDEVVYLAKEDEAEEAYQFGLDIMSTPPSWAASLPVAASGGYAKEYSK